jgi:hypothetical protein
MAVSSRLFSFLGPLPGPPRHSRIMRLEYRRHIVEIAETDYGIWSAREDRCASVISAAHGEPV